MKCPVCTVDLVMSEKKGIEIDYCPQCRGVWLDRGELDKIVERSGAPYPGAGKDYHEQHGGDHYKHHHEHKKYRKKSFFEELFD